MATERRDVELLIRAKDLSSRTLKGISDTIDQVSASLSNQVAAASRGEASIGELEASYKKLDTAIKALAKEEGAVNRFVLLGDALEKAKLRAAEARTAIETFNRSIAAGTTPTAAQAKTLRELEAASKSAEQAVTRTSRSLDAQTQRLTQAGIEVGQIAQAQDRLAGAAQKAASGLAVAQRGLDSYGEAARKAKSDQEIFQASLAQALAPVRQVIQVSQDRASENKQIAALREVAAQAELTAQSYRTLGAAAGGAKAIGSSVADSIRQIVDPAGQARSTLAGLEGQIKSLTTQVNAIVGPVKDYETTLLQIGQAQRAAAQQAGLIDSFRNQVVQVRLAKTAYDEARKSFQDYSAQARANPSEGLIESQKRAQATLRAATLEFNKQVAEARVLREGLRAVGVDTAKLADAQQRLVGVANQTAQAATRVNTAFRDFGRSTQGSGIFGLSPYAVQNLGFQINDVFTQLASGTGIMQVLAQQGGQFFQVFNVGIGSIVRNLPQIAVGVAAAVVAVSALGRAIQQASAVRGFEAQIRLSADGARYQTTALVAASRELQRYGASFDDARKAVQAFVTGGVNSQLVSQLGRLAQNLVDVSQGTLKLPDVAKALAEGFSGGYDAIKRLNDQFPILTAAQLENIRVMFENGRAVEANRAALIAFTAAAESAANLARGPWLIAFRDLKNGWDRLLETIANTGPFRLAERAALSLARGISELLALLPGGSGGPGGAGSPALFSYDRIGANVALRDLQSARTALEGLRRERAALNEVEIRPGTLDGGAAARAAQARFLANASRIDAAIANQERNVAQVETRWREADTAATAYDQRRLDANRELENSGAVAQSQRARGDALALTAANREQYILGLNIKNVTAQDLALLRAQGVAVQNVNDLIRERIAIAGRRAAAPILAADQTATVQAGEVEARARAAERRKIDEEQKTSGSEAIAQSRRDMAAIMEDFRSTVSERDNLIKGIQDRLKEGSISGADAIRQMGEVAAAASPRLQALAAEAARFRDSQRGLATTDSRQGGLRSLTLDANVTAIQTEADSGRAARSGTEAAVKVQTERVNQLLAERNTIVQTYNALVETGAATGDADRRSMSAAFGAIGPQIAAAANEMERLLEAARAAGTLAPEALARLTAQVQLLRAQAQQADPIVTKMWKTIEDTAVNAALKGFEDVATVIGKASLGMITWAEAARLAGNALLNMFAEVLKAIALQILKEQILIALQAVKLALGGGGGVPVRHAGGVVGSGSSQTMRYGVHPSWFAGAPRYHSGTPAVGLKADEQAAILKRGEEVLARDNPRNIANLAKNAGNRGSGEMSIRNVLAFSESDVAGALAGAEGERVILAQLKRNAPSVRQALGIR